MKTNQLLTKVFASAMFAGMMLFGSSVFAQVKIGTNPATIGGTSNLEVEAANGKKVIIEKSVGTVQIDNLPSGLESDSLVTVGPDGVLKRSSLSTIKRILGSSGSAIMTKTNGNQSFAPAASAVPTFNNIVLDEENGLDLTNRTFTVKRAGVYTFSVNTNTIIPGTSGTGQSAGVDLYIMKTSAGVVTTIGRNQVEANAGGGNALNTVTTLSNCQVGDVISVRLVGCINCIPGNPNYTLTSASFYAFKNM